MSSTLQEIPEQLKLTSLNIILLFNLFLVRNKFLSNFQRLYNRYSYSTKFNYYPNSYLLNKKRNISFTTNFANKMPQYEYPKIRRDETVVENFHGVDVNYIFLKLLTKVSIFYISS